MPDGVRGGRRGDDAAEVSASGAFSHTGSHTTASAWWTPILKDFLSWRISPPRVPRCFQSPPSTPFNSASDAFQLHPDVVALQGSTDPSTLHGAFGDACVASSSESDAETQCATFFALPSAAKFENTSLCIVKPHAMANLGLIVDGVLEGGFAVTGMQTFTLDRANASEL